MLAALRILVLVATVVASSGIATAYASCDDLTCEGGDHERPCEDGTCPPGAICSTCSCGAAVTLPTATPQRIPQPESRPAVVSTTSWRLPPSPSFSDIFHPPRLHA